MNRKKFNANLLAYGLGLAMIMGFATSCNDDDDYRGDTYWIEMATVEAPGETGSFNIAQTPFSFLTDSGESLLPVTINYYIAGYTTKDQQRAMIEYRILTNKREGYDHYVNLVDMRNVLTKKLAILTVDTAANSVLRGTAPIRMNELWISNNYVNIIFSYQGSAGSTHYINLVENREITTPPNPDAGVLSLNFVHDSKGDTGTYWFRGIVSFLLPSDLTDVTKIKVTCDNFGTPQSATRNYGASDSAPAIGQIDDPSVK